MMILLSRHLESNSMFTNVLQDKKVKILAESLVEISPRIIVDVPKCDWIFFYSKNGVMYFLDQIAPAEIPANCKWAVMGEGTAKALKAYKIKPDFVGDGNPETTAKAFRKLATGQRILFPCAENSRRSVGKLLSDCIRSMHLPVYENSMRNTARFPDPDILVFTSPMNVKAWFTEKKLLEGQHFVAIGAVTAEALKQHGVEKVLVAETPSEYALAKQVEILL